MEISNISNICLKVQNEQEVKMDLPNQGWLGGSQSNLKPVVASEVLEKCLDQQGIPKNVMLGTKNIKIGPQGPELAHTQCTVGKMAKTR